VPRKPDPVVLIPKKPARVEVVWRDATTHTGSTPFREAVDLGLTERHTIGYLVAEHADRVTVAQSFDPDDGTVDEVTVIPAPWVRRQTKRRK
jgi:hypothetical protein